MAVAVKIQEADRRPSGVDFVDAPDVEIVWGSHLSMILRRLGRFAEDGASVLVRECNWFQCQMLRLAPWAEIASTGMLVASDRWLSYLRTINGNGKLSL